MSYFSSKESKVLTILASLSLHEKSVTLVLDNLISIGIIASTPYVIEKGVSPVDLLGPISFRSFQPLFHTIHYRLIRCFHLSIALEVS